MDQKTQEMLSGQSSQREQRAEVRREKIVVAARALFEERGFHSTSMSQLAARSGVLMGQIYRDFASKEAIVAAIVERDLREFLLDDHLKEACDECDKAAVRSWIQRFISGHEIDDARLVCEIMAESSRNPKVEAIFLKVDDRLRTQIIKALRVILPSPDAADDLASLADVILTLSLGVFHRTISMSAKLDPKAMGAFIGCVDREIAALEAKYGCEA